MRPDPTSRRSAPRGAVAQAVALALAAALPAASWAGEAVFREVGRPPLLIDPSQPEDDYTPKAVSAVESGIAPRKPKNEPAPYRAEFTQKYLAAKAGALDGEFEQANIVAEVPGTGFSFRGRFASRDPGIDRFRDSDQPAWEDPERTRLHDLRVQGSFGGMGYGLRSYSSGDKFEGLPGDKQKLNRGRAGTEFWTSTSAGPFSIQPRVRQTYDNVHLDPKRPRMINNEVGVQVGQVLTDWPTLGYTVSYYSGDRTSAYEPAGTSSQSAGLSSYEGSVYFSTDRFDASVYAQRQLVSDDGTGGAADSLVNYYYANAVFRPTDETGISAWAGVSDEDYTGFGARSLGRDLYVDAYYVPEGSRTSYTAYVGYGDYDNADWYQDYAYSYVGGDVKWVISRLGTEETSLSVGLIYDQYVDRFYSESDESGATVWLRLRHEFDASGRRPQSLGISKP